ncbi:MAG: PAS domain S-box protein [Acidobacteriota bacterium]|nr:MAG: PAS domain S-box protein [Acidobacteriota bacterium]
MEMMVAVADLIAAVGFGVASGFVFAVDRRRIGGPAQLFLMLAMAVYCLVGISNLLEHGGITSRFDRAEDYLEILFLPIFIFGLFSIHSHRELERRRRAENSARTSEAKYRRLVENLRGEYFIYSQNPDGVLTYISPSIREVLGYDSHEALRHYTGVLSDHPINAEAARRGQLSRCGEQQPPYMIEVFHKNGSRRMLEVVETPVRDERGTTIAVEGIAHDVTDREKAAEEALKREKLESLGLLAGGIAHDFNNLLTAIIGNSSMAASQLEEDDDLARHCLSEIEKASKRAQELTRQLLTFAKGGAPIKSVTSLPELIRDAVSLPLTGSNVTCRYEFPPGLWLTEIDPGQIGQVVHNLVLNAVQAMPEGGELRISAANSRHGEDSLLPLAPGRYVRISIKDQGAGIRGQDLPRIFDPYFSTKEAGSGLGLAVAYSTLKRHHGYITVQSELGSGSEFQLFLPAAAETSDVSDPGVNDLVPGHGKLLVMEDERVVRDAVRGMLEQLGYETVTAADGREAIELYRRALIEGSPFDIVLLDLTVRGGMGGREAIDHLRQIDPGVRAIVSSGYANAPIMSEYASYGFQAVLPKPYQLGELGQVLQRVLTQAPTPGNRADPTSHP